MRNKFLIVLDDVWKDDYVEWTEVMKPFIVTNVIGIVDTHHLRELSKDECWALFVKHTFSGNFRKLIENPKLERIGREIVKKY
ncbi:hypothetical protein F8388_025776 [Cannabis sativa]|uniref:NB-ARC domain-containing protein n=1 Tax=Cannabis sativa TaxID=3483 RepID=A0A7J6F9U4_CANSA|nr:hypothetical protein F8388_025776 [Cannabis sativa]